MDLAFVVWSCVPCKILCPDCLLASFQKIVEKEVIREVPVDKIIVKEVPVYVDRVVEKEMPVEVVMIVEKIVEREVIKEIPVDRIVKQGERAPPPPLPDARVSLVCDQGIPQTFSLKSKELWKR